MLSPNITFYGRLWTCVLLLCITTPLFSQRSGLTHLTWNELKKAKHGTIYVYWYESKPFVYKNASGKMEGIEAELMEGFKNYLRDNHHINLTIEWKEAKDFGDTYSSIQSRQIEGTFGMSAFSITPERQEQVGFTPPYMADICVLISSENVPIVKNAQEFNEQFSKLTAITIQHTTYEYDLEQLKRERDISFATQYIPSSANIMDTIAKMDNAFTFIDLPVYMMTFRENPSIAVRRQNLFPTVREGYGIIYPKNSDWSEPWNEYFSKPDFKSQFETIIGHYIDHDLYFFIENLALQSTDPVALLTKEKEIQLQDLASKSERIRKEQQARNILIVLSSVVLAFLLFTVYLYRKQHQQKRAIELQRERIELKSQQLEKRNQHLMAMDEEKDNLINILAHDLRTPINHVQGLAQLFLLSNPHLDADQRQIIQQINDSSVRLNKMITNLLDIDAIESDRVKILSEELKITSLLQEIITSFEKTAEKKNISFDFSSSSNLTLKGDPLLIIQIFENLISNALKFSPKGKRITISVTDHQQSIRISIIDEGPGLTGEDMKLIFKKFQRLSAQPTDGEKSLGLGLSIVKRYVELMGGEIRCESFPGKGAKFTLEFNKA